MKKIICLWSIVAILFVSCSSDDSSNPINQSSDILPVKVIQTYLDGSVFTGNLHYDGNKLLETVYEEVNVKIKYTYTGELITKIDYFRDNSLFQEEFFQYDSNSRLINFKIFEYINEAQNYVKDIDYVYNEDGTVGLTTMSGENSQSLTFSNTAIFTLNEFGEVLIANHEGYIETFTYDNKNSPVKNILGFDKLLFSGNHPNAYLHNFITEVSPDYNSTSTYTYNSLGYPLVMVENNDNDIITTQYFYND